MELDSRTERQPKPNFRLAVGFQSFSCTNIAILTLFLHTIHFSFLIKTILIFLFFFFFEKKDHSKLFFSACKLRYVQNIYIYTID